MTLLTLIGGLTVGDFYWNDLRPDMGRIGANLAQARDRQRTMMGNFAEAQALLLEQQRHMWAREGDLRSREQEVYEARLAVEAQRALLAQDIQAESQRQRAAARDGGPASDSMDGGGRAASGTAAEDTGTETASAPAPVAQAAEQVRAAARGLARNDDLGPARDALAAAEALLAGLPGPRGDPGRAALAAARTRLAETRPMDRADLGRRLQAIRERAANLRPLVARLLRSNGQVRQSAEGLPHQEDPVQLAASSLDRQFQAAALALEAADGAGFRLAMQGIDRWLNAFYEPRFPDVASVLTEVRALTATPIAADVAPLVEALERLAATLRETAGYK